MIHSLIGGTGGGLGCSVLETIKEELPNIHVTSVTTSPFISGESPMQHYNSLLTLAWLQRFVLYTLFYSALLTFLFIFMKKLPCYEGLPFTLLVPHHCFFYCVHKQQDKNVYALVIK